MNTTMLTLLITKHCHWVPFAVQELKASSWMRSTPSIPSALLQLSSGSCATTPKKQTLLWETEYRNTRTILPGFISLLLGYWLQDEIETFLWKSLSRSAGSAEVNGNSIANFSEISLSRDWWAQVCSGHFEVFVSLAASVKDFLHTCSSFLMSVFPPALSKFHF